MPVSTRALPGRMYRTWTLARPIGPAFWRVVDCREFECVRWRNGWRTVLDLTTVDGVKTARWISGLSGRTFTHETAGQTVTFTFPAGQRCFEKHRRPLEREPLYVVRAGKLNPRAPVQRRHVRGEDWRDEMQDDLGKLAEQKKREG